MLFGLLKLGSLETKGSVSVVIVAYIKLFVLVDKIFELIVGSYFSMISKDIF